MVCHSEIEKRFGITEVKDRSPNFSRTVTWNPAGLGKCGIQLTWLVTDGKHDASGRNGKSMETAMSLKTAVSELRHTATDATWTVVCEYLKHGTEVERCVILYTERTCYKELYKDLDKFLTEQEYGTFEDIVEVFLTE